MSRVRAR
jgi:hypothetical protein